MLSGIITSFIESTNLAGNRSFDYALLETDEANVALLMKEIQVQTLLITNFFRDQLDRFGELDHTVHLIKDALQDKKLELVLNADDPLLSDFQQRTGLKCWHYGFAETVYDDFSSADSREGRFCVVCGHELQYERYHYAQLGKYQCPGCHNQNPSCDFEGMDLKMTPVIDFKVNDLEIRSPYQGFYNAYNMLAAVSMGKLLGIGDEIIQRAIRHYQPQAGRLERFMIGEKSCMLVLVKNPTGLNQTINMLVQDPSRKALFIALNDNAADGRDISWIWDAYLEVISDERAAIDQVICSGQRSGDMALRIKYTGFDPGRISIEERIEDGIKAALQTEAETAYILCTYTALLTCRKFILKMQGSTSPFAEGKVMTASNK